MRRPGPRLIAPRGVAPRAAGALLAPQALSPWPINTPLLRAPDDAPWQKWFSVLGTAVNALLGATDGGGGGGVSSAVMPYRYSSATNAPPSAGQVRFDAAFPYTAVTTVWIAIINQNGDDMHTGLMAIPAGSTILVQNTTDHTHFAEFETLADAVDAGAYVTFAVVHVAHEVALAHNETVLLRATRPSAHAPTHEPGGSDPLVNAAWTNVANVFTATPQVVQTVAPVVSLRDTSASVDSKRWDVTSASGGLSFTSRSDSGAYQTTPLLLYRSGDVDIEKDLKVNGMATVYGNTNVSGLLTVNGFGTHSFSAYGAGVNVLQLRNPAAGAANGSALYLGNDVSAFRTTLYCLSSAYAPLGQYQPESTVFEAGGSNGLSIAASNPSGGAIRFYSGGSNLRLRIYDDGAIAMGATLKFYLDGGSNTYLTESATDLLDIVSGGSGGVRLTAGATAWAALSDERLKTDLVPITDASRKIAQVRAVTGRYRTDAASVRRALLIGQDVHAVLPEAVSLDPDGYLNLRYADLIPLLVAGHQDHDRRLAALEAKETHAE